MPVNQNKEILILLLAAGGQILSGQTSPSSEIERTSFSDRFTVGGRVSILAADLMNTETFRRSTSTPVVSTELNAQSTAFRLSGGPTFEVALRDKLALSVDFLYRRAGHKFGEDTITGIDDEDTEDVNEQQITSVFEQTRADYWDIPVLARFYDSSRQHAGTRAFLNGGIAIRHASSIRTFREVTNPDGVTTSGEATSSPANSTIAGVVIGGGFLMRSKVGLKVAPELRFTRWLSDTFYSPPTQSRRNQFEIMIAFGF